MFASIGLLLVDRVLNSTDVTTSDGKETLAVYSPT